MNSSSRILCIASFAAVLALSGCSKKTTAGNSATDNTTSSSATESATNSTASNATATTPAATAAATGVPAATPLASDGQENKVEITANDTMKFSLTEIKAKPGESVSVTLKNVGTLPKTAMGHNFVLFKSADAVQPFINESAQAGATDYIPASQKGNLIASTKLLGPGESDTVTFKAPDQAGHYPFICSFPGHYQVGMKGELVVE